ncbi:AraC family transcriptional regulator [Xanthobacter sp. KR7-65]|uniref:AraC family transcriptional regulator n=1 Tax=Xanthobacter sp. KR7-65 TaxID=3156612 RepID=UPI0032B43FF4
MSTQEQSAAVRGRSPARDSLGCTVASLGPPQELSGNGFVIYRRTHRERDQSRVETEASGRGLLAGVALGAGHRRRIFEAGRKADYAFAPDSCYVRSFLDDYRADIVTGFDFVLVEIAPRALHRACADLDLPPVDALSCSPGTADPVLAGLARALLPSLAAPERSAALFVDQVATAIQLHLVLRLHGGNPRPERRRGMSLGQVRRAQELLVESLQGNVLIGDVADACGVSRSQFIRGFRAATGVTPYQWLLRQRVERARELLVNSSLPLADVALSCGFSDQSHMTRTVSRHTGLAPGAWRRRH